MLSFERNLSKPSCCLYHWKNILVYSYWRWILEPRVFSQVCNIGVFGVLSGLMYYCNMHVTEAASEKITARGCTYISA